MQCILLLKLNIILIFKYFLIGLVSVRYMEPENLQKFDLPFSTHSTTGAEIPLSSRYNYITAENRLEYIRLALNYRYYKFYFTFPLCFYRYLQ